MWHLVHKETGKALRVNATSKGFYQSRASVVRACKVSGILLDLGLKWDDCVLMDHWGRTFEDRCSVPVQEGYALRHKEGWYWNGPFNSRVWYKLPRTVQLAWKMAERDLARIEGRMRYADPGKVGFELVQGFADGHTEVRIKHW